MSSDLVVGFALGIGLWSCLLLITLVTVAVRKGRKP